MTLELIHPSIRNQVYLGSAVTGLAAAALFCKDLPESIKIIAATTLSGVAATFINYWSSYPNLKYLTVGSRPLINTRGEICEDFGQYFPNDKLLIRSSSGVTHYFLLSVKSARLFGLAGGVLAFVARAPIPGLTKKVDIKDMKYFGLFIQVVCSLLSLFESPRRGNSFSNQKSQIHFKKGFNDWFVLASISSIGILASRVRASLS